MYQLLNALCLVAVFAAARASTTLTDFKGAQWIWLRHSSRAEGDVYRPGNATFRREIYPEDGKTPTAASILIAADDAYTLYVNGNQVGASNNYKNAQRYCVPFNQTECNVVAVEGENLSALMAGSSDRHAYGYAGLLAAIEVRYTDGSTQTIFSDAEWRSITGAPKGFAQIGFDDMKWKPAFEEGPWPKTYPWLNNVNIPTSVSIGPIHLPSLPSAEWIWTDEVNANGNAPAGARAFRKTLALAPGQLVDTMIIDITTDNQYTLYVNGMLVGSGTTFQRAQRYQVKFELTSEVIVAVYAFNEAGPAALIASAQFVGCECGCGNGAAIVTDDSWKYSSATMTGFEKPGFDDSLWHSSRVQGPYGIGPWGSIGLPSTNSPQNAGIKGAPSAPPAVVIV